MSDKFAEALDLTQELLGLAALAAITGGSFHLLAYLPLQIAGKAAGMP